MKNRNTEPVAALPWSPRALAALTVALLLFLPWNQSRAHGIDLIEHILGATNIHAISGAGTLTIGVSREGDLTVLTWPSPSYADQLNYVTSNDEDAREQPRFGASEGMGAFGGLVYTTEEGGELRVSWFRDDDWSHEIGYLSQRSSVITTTFTHEDLGLNVVQTDLVDETNDVWVRRYEVSKAPASPVHQAWVMLYANLAPTLSRVPMIPLADWAMEPRNDYAALFDDEAGLIVHFHPGDTGVIDELGDVVIPEGKRYGPIGEALTEAGGVSGERVDSLLATLDEDYAPGVYLALGSAPAPDGWQVGFDETDLCSVLDVLSDNFLSLGDRYPEMNLGSYSMYADLIRCPTDDHPGLVISEEQGWEVTAADALADAADGELSGSRVAAGHVNETLRVPVEFVEVGDELVGEVVFYLGAGSTSADARAALESVRGGPVGELVTSTTDAHESWVSALALPDAPGIDPLLVDFSARTLLNLRVGMDRETSAIVASISRQPPYGEDWPRDGAFFNTALDVAGLHDDVDARMRFYAEIQRDEEAEPGLIDGPGPGFPDDQDNHNYPADAWEMNYYADGMVGGNIRWEIDNTALIVWSFVAHAGYIEDDSDRLTYLEEVYPNIERAADLLVYWRDDSNYLPWPAHEDDNLAFTQGLQGAGTTFGALRASAMAARELGNDDDAARWEQRAAEIRWAIETHLYDEEYGFQEGVTENPGSAAGGASSWLAWPAMAFGPDDARMLDQLSLNMDYVLAAFDPDSEGGAYLTKAALATALIHTDEAERERALELAVAMVEQVADGQTLFLGEVFAAVDDDGDGIFDGYDNRVSTPHLWAATLVYLTLMAYYHPERFDPHEELLPAAEIPEEVEPPVTEDAGPDAGPDAGDAGPDADQESDVPLDAHGGGCSCRNATVQPNLRTIRLMSF